MNEYINNDNGTVSLDENVVAQVAGMTAIALALLVWVLSV